MKPETIQKLCCPFDKADLTLTPVVTNTDGNVLEGFFTCTECRRLYPIVKGIPVMSPDEYREFRLEKPLLDHWQTHLQGKTIENFRLPEGE